MLSQNVSDPKKELPPLKILIKIILRDGRQPFIVAILVIILDLLKDSNEAFKSWIARPWYVLIIGVAVFSATFFVNILIEAIFFSIKYSIEARKAENEGVVFENIISKIANKDELAKIEEKVTGEIFIMTASFVIEREFGKIIAGRLRNGVPYNYIIPSSQEDIFCEMIKNIASQSKHTKEGDNERMLDNVHYVCIQDYYFNPQTFIMYKYKCADDIPPKYSIYMKLSSTSAENQVYYYENMDERSQYDEKGKTIYPHGSKVAIKHQIESLFENSKKVI